MPELPLTLLAIEPRHLALLQSLLRAHLPDAEILAYGSRVNGDSHPASDLDLVARRTIAAADGWRSVVKTREALSQSNLPIRVDLLDWDDLPASFHTNIERAYVVIQPTPGRQAA